MSRREPINPNKKSFAVLPKTGWYICCAKYYLEADVPPRPRQVELRWRNGVWVVMENRPCGGRWLSKPCKCSPTKSGSHLLCSTNPRLWRMGLAGFADFLPTSCKWRCGKPGRFHSVRVTASSRSPHCGKIGKRRRTARGGWRGGFDQCAVCAGSASVLCEPVAMRLRVLCVLRRIFFFFSFVFLNQF